MKTAANIFAKKISSNSLRPGTVEFRSRTEATEGWISIIVNFLLFAIKLVLGLLSRSIALVADAFHSLSDMSSSIIIIVSAKIAKKPSDLEHPFGHQRVEAIATIIIATLLFVTGIELGRSAIGRILHPATFTSSNWIIGVILLTILLKESLARFSSQLGEISQSTLLKADAWHHRSDALTTLLVMVTFIFARFNIFYLDGYVGVAMSLFIMYSGFDVAKEAMHHLIGTAPEAEFIQNVKRIAGMIPGVSNVHDLILHQYGANKLLSLHIEVPTHLTLLEAHDLAEKVEAKIKKELKTHTTVHYEPAIDHNSLTDSVRQVIVREIKADDRLESFHALHSAGEESNKNLYFDLVVQPGISLQEIENIRDKMTAVLKESCPDVKQVTMRIEPSYPIPNQLD